LLCCWFPGLLWGQLPLSDTWIPEEEETREEPVEDEELDAEMERLVNQMSRPAFGGAHRAELSEEARERIEEMRERFAPVPSRLRVTGMDRRGQRVSGELDSFTVRVRHPVGEFLVNLAEVASASLESGVWRFQLTDGDRLEGEVEGLIPLRGSDGGGRVYRWADLKELDFTFLFPLED